MLLLYVPLSLVIILVSTFALYTLRTLNSINDSIIKTDMPIRDAADKMIDNLFVQELYGRRYAVLKSPEMLELFRKRDEEFEQEVARIRTLSDHKAVPLNRLYSLHKEYKELFITGTDHLGKPQSKTAKKLNEEIKLKQEELIALIKKISADTLLDQKRKRLDITTISRRAFRVTAGLCIVGIALGIVTAALITRNITGHINQLRIATHKISEGKFDQIPDIQNQDELGELSNAFGEMAKRLQSLEEMYLDASPLTKLPGSIATENVVKKRIDVGAEIAFCLVDIDNFKSFNDRYGYARGNDVIKATAKIIELTVAEYGASDDFVGHIGGDDFIFVTTRERCEKICNAVIELFDKTIPGFYDPEDRERGFLSGLTRQGQEASYPLISISIAVVTNNKRELINHIQIGEIAAELKDYAKSLPGSVYVVDRRKS